jgi:hypothetical protein
MFPDLKNTFSSLVEIIFNLLFSRTENLGLSDRKFPFLAPAARVHLKIKIIVIIIVIIIIINREITTCLHLSMKKSICFYDNKHDSGYVIVRK